MADAWFALLLPLILPLVVGLTLEFWLRIFGQAALVDRLFGEGVISVGFNYALAIVIEVGVIGWLMRLRGATFTGLGLRRTAWRWFVAAVGLYFVQILLLTGIFVVIDKLLPSIDTQEAQSVLDFGRVGLGWWLSFIAAAVIAPVIEEIMFRGVVFAGFASRWSSWLAAVVSSLAFALLHGQVNVGIYTFVLGLLLCWLYARSRSIWPGILLHMANNLIAFVLLTGAK